MNTTRGFIPLAPILLIGLVVLGGIGWWTAEKMNASQATNEIPSSTTEVSKNNGITEAFSSTPTLIVTNVNPNGTELTVEYQNMPKEAKSLFLCVPDGGCTEWGVGFSPTTPNGTFTMIMPRPEGSTKTMGKGTFTVQAVDFSIGKIFATSMPFTVQ
jgi:hypothetical protein